MSLRTVLLVCAALAVAACGKETPVDPNGGNNNGTSGVSGSVGGVAFNNSSWSLSYDPASAEYNFASLSTTGAGAGLILEGVTQPGTYPLTNSAAGFSSGFAYLAGVQASYSTLFGPGAGNGSAVVTVATATRLAGTASFTAYPQPGETGTPKAVTIQFDITVNSTPSIMAAAATRSTSAAAIEAQRIAAAIRP